MQFICKEFKLTETGSGGIFALVAYLSARKLGLGDGSPEICD